jgi:hypothetical protein
MGVGRIGAIWVVEIAVVRLVGVGMGVGVGRIGAIWIIAIAAIRLVAVGMVV